MATIAQEIADIEELLNTGATSVTVDGQSVSVDQAALRRRLAELRHQQTPARRPRVATLDLSGF